MKKLLLIICWLLVTACTPASGVVTDKSESWELARNETNYEYGYDCSYNTDFEYECGYGWHYVTHTYYDRHGYLFTVVNEKQSWTFEVNFETYFKYKIGDKWKR